jgi:hypothetical protein
MSVNPTSPTPDNEPFPVDETIKVIKGTTIYKNKKWWFAVLLVNSFGHNKVMMYQWQMNETQGKWKRKQKITFNFSKDWDASKPIVDAYMKEGNI